MNQKLLLLTGLIACPFLSLTTAFAASYPKKNPVLHYEAPKEWTSEESKDGNLSINSSDGRVSVNFGEVESAASMDLFQQMLPAMVKLLKEPVETDKPKVHTEDGLTGYTVTYTGKIDDKPAMVIFVLFEGGKEHAILANMILSEPETLPKEDGEGFGSFMKSLKTANKAAEKPAGNATASAYPQKRPVISYELPTSWTSETDKDDGSISINSTDERVSVNFAEVPATATMEIFEQMLPDMTKDLGKPVVAKKPEEHTEDGLSGFTATYTGTADEKPVTAIFVLFKAGKDRSILGNLLLLEPETLPKEDGEAFGSFMKSLKAFKK